MKLWVIKAGGELLAKPTIRKKIIKGLGHHFKGAPVAFVHGGGPQIKAALAKNKIHLPKVNGRRVTTKKAMVIVEKVLSGKLNKSIASNLLKNKVNALGLSGRDGGLIIGRVIPQLKRAAKPTKVNLVFFKKILKGGILPVISTVANDKNGQAVNINADDAASALAIKAKASRLVFLTDVPGVLGKNKKRISILKIKKIPALIKNGTIHGGMIPKVQSAAAAIKKGVGEVDILDGRRGINLKYGTRIKK